jgi:hypothetical protein
MGKHTMGSIKKNTWAGDAGFRFVYGFHFLSVFRVIDGDG